MSFSWRTAATGISAPSEPVEFGRVSKRHPCPVCGHTDWCGASLDGRLARCMRVESDKPSTGSDGATGWIHVLSELPPPPARKHRVYTPKPKRSMIDFSAVMDRYMAQTTISGVARFACELHVTVASLQRLGAAWGSRAWAFPMRDAAGQIIGIRLRSPEGGKYAVTGSSQGLFMPRYFLNGGEPVYVCEGPTDTAAVLDLGFAAVGRPSCRGGGPMLAKRLAGRAVVIVADRDEPKFRPDGSVWYPGRDGAADLAKQLVDHCSSVKVIQPPPPYKDAREWISGGGTRNAFQLRTQLAHEW